jgi:hypothetical protein
MSRVPFGLPIFTHWLREDDPDLSFQKKFLDILFDYNWTCEKLLQLKSNIPSAEDEDSDIQEISDEESMPSFTLSDFGQQFLWDSLRSLDLIITRDMDIDVFEADVFVLLLATTCPNLIELHFFCEELSANALGEVVLKCPHIENLTLGIIKFDYDNTLYLLGNSPRHRPMNIRFHVDVNQLPFWEEDWPTFTAEAIEAFALSNVELSSFAVFFTNVNHRSRRIMTEISNGMDRLKDIRSFSYLICPHIHDGHKQAIVVGDCRSIVYFYVPTQRRYRYRKNDFFRLDILRFSVNGEDDEENELAVEEKGEDLIDYQELIASW